MQVYILVQRASLLGQIGNLAEGYKCIDKARVLIGTSGSEMEKSLCDLEFAGLDLIGGNIKDSIPLLEDACAYFKKEGHKVQCDRTHLYLTLAYIKTNQPEKLIEHLLQIISIIDEDLPSAGLIAISSRFQSDLQNCKIGYLQEKLNRLFEKIDEFNSKFTKN